MKASDTKAFGRLMDFIGDAYGQKVTQKRKEAFFRVLQDIPFEDVKKNVTIMLRSRKFTSFPVPADIRNPVSDDDRKMQVTNAWLEVMHKIETVGHWESVQFEDARTMKAIDAMGGWEEFAQLNVDQVKWKRMEFEKVYFSVDPVDAPLSLPGAHERINQEKKAAAVKALADEKRKALPSPKAKRELDRRRKTSERENPTGEEG